MVETKELKLLGCSAEAGDFISTGCNTLIVKRIDFFAHTHTTSAFSRTLHSTHIVVWLFFGNGKKARDS